MFRASKAYFETNYASDELILICIDQAFGKFQVILDEAITKLSPDFFWLGGGEIDLKLGVRTSEFLDFVKPFVVPCS